MPNIGDLKPSDGVYELSLQLLGKSNPLQHTHLGSTELFPEPVGAMTLHKIY